jgi:hypothetical protein
MPLDEADGLSGCGQLSGYGEADHAGPDYRDVDVGHADDLI